MARPRLFQRPSRTVLARQYRTMTDAEIAGVHGCTRQVVKSWRRAYGIKGIRRAGDGIGAPRQFVRPSKAALQSLTDRKTDQEIAEIFGCSRTAIRKWRATYDLPKLTTVYRRRPWAYDLNERFFAKINTEEKAYLLACSPLTAASRTSATQTEC